LKNELRKWASKLYSIEVLARGKSYRLAGLGAIYTQQECQGRGYGTKLIKSVIKNSRNQGYDGLLLYSEIGAEFYENLGFQLLSYNNFMCPVPESYAQTRVETQPLSISHIDWMDCHYRRWLRRRTFGINRSPQYFAYKIKREAYMHSCSKLNWPQLEILQTDLAETGQGYVIFELGDNVLRVLEAISQPGYESALWQQLVCVANNRQAKHIRGWEATRPVDLPASTYERHWGWPMLLPLNSELHKFSQIEPCPLLELDHF
jgi:GNAT superfamily N-acetyltransferase